MTALCPEAAEVLGELYLSAASASEHSSIVMNRTMTHVELWNSVADGYLDRARLGRDHFKSTWPWVERQLARVPPHATILDFGCGPGVWSQRLATMGFRILGLDPSDRMIELCKAHHPHASVDYVVGEVSSLPGTQQYDAVLCVNVLGNVPNLQFTLGELGVRLRAGGTAVFVLEHPCFMTWRDSRGKYLEEHEYLSHFLGQDQTPVRGYHRPLATYLNELVRCGLSIRESAELAHPEASAAKPFLALSCTKTHLI